MAEGDTEKGKLPGNHGQFGETNATEDYKPLREAPAPSPPAPFPPAPEKAPAGAAEQPR